MLHRRQHPARHRPGPARRHAAAAGQRLRHLRQRRHALPPAHRAERAVARHPGRRARPAWSTSARAASCASIDAQATEHGRACRPTVRGPILQGLVGVIRNYVNGHKGTAVEPFRTYNYDAFPIAGKTGTAQDASKLDENDTSLFVGFGPSRPTRRRSTRSAPCSRRPASAPGRRRRSCAACSRPCPGSARWPTRSRPSRSTRTPPPTAAVLPPLSDTSCLVSPPTGHQRLTGRR